MLHFIVAFLVRACIVRSTSVIDLRDTEQAMTDADWERRLRKRLAAVAHVEKSKDYVVCSVNGVPLEAPLDPRDRSVSKRRWECSIQNWRRALHAAASHLAL